MDVKFKNAEKDIKICDIDWCNMFYDFSAIFEDCDAAVFLSKTEVAVPNPNSLSHDEMKTPTFVLDRSGMVEVKKPNAYGFKVGMFIPKFTILCTIKFNGNAGWAESYIAYQVRDKNFPYIRVATDYFMVIEKENRFGGISTILKPWKKETISDDHGKPTLSIIPKYLDFVIVPDNIRHSFAHNRCYNLYAPFPHKPAASDTFLEEIPHTETLLKHIFGDQIELGMRYMKLLYEKPKQILPVLCLVSEERETGKTTFLNWIQMIFGENSVQISPQTLTSDFNDAYATKNIVIIDETVVEKSTSIEKLKTLATAKTISVSQKFISHYSVPFFGKIIIATNKEKDFMRIDENEIRFWIRKVPPINGDKNTNIEKDLFSEIPKFLRFLTQLPDVDLSKTRMVFTPEEIGTTELNAIKHESKSGLRKELEMLLEDFFDNNPSMRFFESTAKDIKEKWFISNHQITLAYLRKVLNNEMKMDYGVVRKYNPFGGMENASATGRPYVFNNPNPPENGTTEVPKKEGVWWDPDNKTNGDLPF